jgi:hypothetical protein
MALGLTGAGCPGLGGSGEYKPLGPGEIAAHRKAVRDVFPADVRKDPQRYSNTLVAWAGVLRSFEATKEGNKTVLRFVVEHRYFDWLTNYGFQADRFFLSPRGEGVFKASWSLPLEAFDSIPRLLHNGEMLVIYGNPSEVVGDTIVIAPTAYARIVSAAGFTDQELDYGRPGEAVKAPRP